MRNVNVLAKKHIDEVLSTGKLIGSNDSCPSYPCHFEGQDCTWCYCPLYPCLSDRNGGYIITGTGRRIWDCSRCVVIHKRGKALKVLNILKKSRSGIDEINSGIIASARKIVAAGE
jgi:threonine-phosphate decarboxylase